MTSTEYLKTFRFQQISSEEKSKMLMMMAINYKVGEM